MDVTRRIDTVDDKFWFTSLRKSNDETVDHSLRERTEISRLGSVSVEE